MHSYNKFDLVKIIKRNDTTLVNYSYLADGTKAFRLMWLMALGNIMQQSMLKKLPLIKLYQKVWDLCVVL